MTKNDAGGLGSKQATRPNDFFVFSGKIIFLVLGFILTTSIITYILYGHTQKLLSERLKERLEAIVATAAISFNPEEISLITGPKDMERDSFRKIVEHLAGIRNANSNIQFAYIMKRTEDPNFFAFVADADSLSSLAELDENSNGQWDKEEIPPKPGDLYSVIDFPVLRDEAFYHPAVDRILQKDSWGLSLAAYAPIIDKNGNAIAIVGIDVLVNEFTYITQAMLLPFLLFILLLSLLILLLTIQLVRFYTERVNAVKELDKQKDELLGIVSHQLAAPVTALRWNLESLDDGDLGTLGKDQRQVIKEMQAMTIDLADLVGMILDVSRIQLGRMNVQKQDLDLIGLLEEICTVVEPKAISKKIVLKKSLPQSLPTASLDQRLTRMTIENLLTNAIKYTPDGGFVQLTVKLIGETIYCEVKDTGCGIPKADQAKIFGRLFRASNVRNSIEGNGFGLYVAKGAIESQGGKITFESEEGKGTTFWLELPLRDEKNS